MGQLRVYQEKIYSFCFLIDYQSPGLVAKPKTLLSAYFLNLSFNYLWTIIIFYAKNRIVGVGHLEKVSSQQLARNIRCRSYCFMDSNEEIAAEVIEKYGIKRFWCRWLLSKCDAIDIVTPIHTSANHDWSSGQKWARRLWKNHLPTYGWKPWTGETGQRIKH